MRPAVWHRIVFALTALSALSVKTNGTIAAESSTAVKAVLGAYNQATQRLDLAGTLDLFTADSEIVESGSVEGTYAYYLTHHIGPELAEFKSFSFSDYTVKVVVLGRVAYATETFGFRIRFKKNEPAIDRLAVATSVLLKNSQGWKIARYHWSSRKLPPKTHPGSQNQ